MDYKPLKKRPLVFLAGELHCLHGGQSLIGPKEIEMRCVVNGGFLLALLLTVSPAAFGDAVVLLTGPAETAAAGAAAAVMSAKVRAGGTGFETALLAQPGDVQKRTANFSGNSALIPGDWRNFEVDYSSSSGILTLKVDADQSGSFGVDNGTQFNSPNETMSWNFGTAGFGFQYIDLFYRGASTGQVDLRNLVMNGVNQANLSSGAVNFTHAYFGRDGGGYLGDITITGQFDLTGVRVSDEVPGFGVVLRGQGTPTVPDGGTTLALLGGTLMGLAALRRKFRV